MKSPLVLVLDDATVEKMLRKQGLWRDWALLSSPKKNTGFVHVRDPWEAWIVVRWDGFN